MSEVSLAQRVLGVGSPQEVAGALAMAHFMLSGEGRTADEIRDEAILMRDHVRECGLWDDTNKTERSIALMALLQIFDDREITFATNFNSWPVYQKLFEQNVRQNPDALQDIEHALLIGSFSALSSRAFVAQAEDTYDVQKGAYIIDVASGVDKRQQGNFIYGDGLRLPFGNSKLQLVQTNQLLSTIVGPERLPMADDAAEKAAADLLLTEVFRVLQPGGHLLMRECASQLTRADKESGYRNAQSRERIRVLWETLPEALLAAGFTTIRIEEAKEMVGVDYLFDPSRNFAEHPTIRSPTAVAVYASKQS